jgi:hypothetical protein
MSEVTHNVRDIETGEREALENLLGMRLQENQKLVISVQPIDVSKHEPEFAPPQDTATAKLPEWCNVYHGLSEAEVEEIEKSIVRTPGSRSIH